MDERFTPELEAAALPCVSTVADELLRSAGFGPPASPGRIAAPESPQALP